MPSTFAQCADTCNTRNFGSFFFQQRSRMYSSSIGLIHAKFSFLRNDGFILCDVVCRPRFQSAPTNLIENCKSWTYCIPCILCFTFFSSTLLLNSISPRLSALTVDLSLISRENGSVYLNFKNNDCSGVVWKEAPDLNVPQIVRKHVLWTYCSCGSSARLKSCSERVGIFHLRTCSSLWISLSNKHTFQMFITPASKGFGLSHEYISQPRPCVYLASFKGCYQQDHSSLGPYFGTVQTQFNPCGNAYFSAVTLAVSDSW